MTACTNVRIADWMPYSSSRVLLVLCCECWSWQWSSVRFAQLPMVSLCHLLTFVGKNFWLVRDSLLFLFFFVSYIGLFLPVTEDFACPFCLVKCGSYKVKFEDNLHLVYLFKCCLLLLRPGICVIYYIWGKKNLLFHTSHLLFIQMLLIAGLFLGTVITLSTLSYLFLWE